MTVQVLHSRHHSRPKLRSERTGQVCWMQGVTASNRVSPNTANFQTSWKISRGHTVSLVDSGTQCRLRGLNMAIRKDYTISSLSTIILEGWMRERLRINIKSFRQAVKDVV